MTPDTVILTMTAIAAVAMFVAFHFAIQASYYRSKVKSIAAYVAPQKSGTARKVHRMAIGAA